MENFGIRFPRIDLSIIYKYKSRSDTIIFNFDF